MVFVFGSFLADASSYALEGDRTRAADRPASRNAIVGLGGGDVLRGLGGDDLLSGGAGDDGLYGGPGNDVLLAGRGEDLVVARDGDQDYVGCGPGRDTAIVDPVDRVALGCETTQIGR